MPAWVSRVALPPTLCPQRVLGLVGADVGPPCAVVRGRPKFKSRASNVTTSGGCDTLASCRARLDPQDCFIFDPEAPFSTEP